MHPLPDNLKARIMNTPTLVIGAGPIGSEYIKVLARRGVAAIDVLTRTEASAEKAKASPGVRAAFHGGQPRLREIAGDYGRIIVAVPVDDLLPMLRAAAETAPKARILVEKPVSLDGAGLQAFLDDFPNAPVMAALNRLFFPSVRTLHARLANDPALSGRFCFTEWTHRLPVERFSAATLARWGVANSIHLISTYFDLMGHPVELAPLRSGALPWHPAGARFYGCGRTEGERPFTYDADWESGGRYHIEIFTAAGVYTMKPLHELRFTPCGEIADEIVEPMYAGEIKCGFDGMVDAFVGDRPDHRERLGLPNLMQHIRTVERMFGYDQP